MTYPGIESLRPTFMGTTHMVAAGHYLAAEAGYRILEQGGNAVDAGVAAGIAINVLLPESTNFGGVAPIMIYLAASDSVITISGLGRWPRAANIDYFMEHSGGEISKGILQSIVPAAPDAWLTALERYGTKTFGEVVTPALQLARDGFPMNPVTYGGLLEDADPVSGTLADGPPPVRFSCPMAESPRSAAYLSSPTSVAPSSASQMSRPPMLISADRRQYAPPETISTRETSPTKWPVSAKSRAASLPTRTSTTSQLKSSPPVKASFRDYTIYTCGPWCQGPVVGQVLQMLENDDLEALGHNSADYLHLYTEAMDRAFADRHHYYGDPDFIDVPIEGILSKGYTELPPLRHRHVSYTGPDARTRQSLALPESS